MRRHEWSLPLSLASTISLAYLAIEMRAGDLDGMDAAILGRVHGWRGQLDGIMSFLTTIGSGKGMAALAALGVLALLGFRRWRHALFMAVAALGTLLLNMSLKLLFARQRPEGLEYLIGLPPSFSFPSGHAMGSMGVLASCVVVSYALGAPLLVRLAATLLGGVLVFGIALSRVYFGVHYPSDVVGGQLAAAAWVSALTGWFYPWLMPGEATSRPASAL